MDHEQEHRVITQAPMMGAFLLEQDMNEYHDKCDLCDAELTDVKYDAATTLGPWGILCRSCMGRYGLGLGTGRGQEYKHDGKYWIKTKG